MRRIGSGSRAIWCSRPARVRRTSPARSSTFTCFETALNDMSKGWARSVTRAAPFASRWTICRRVGSESAAKARSRTGGVIYSTCRLNIAAGPPLSSDRRSSRCYRSDSAKALYCERHEGVFTMTLPRGTDRLESARLVLRRLAPDDLPFFTRIHALPEVARYLWGQGRPRSPEETAAWLQVTLASYEQLALGHPAVLRKEDGALIGRCGLTDLAVESAAAERGIRRGWFGRAQAPAGVALTFECELGYTFDPAFWGQGFATEAARCVRDYARDVLRLTYAISAILPQNARSRRVAERSGGRAAGQMEVVGLTWDRYEWPLATGGPARLQPASTK